MKRYARKFLSLVMLVVCVVSTVMLAKHWRSMQAGSAAHSSAQQISLTPQEETVPQVETAPQETVPPAKHAAKKLGLAKKVWAPAPVEEDDPHMEALGVINLDALRAVNPEVVGWILIPDTGIDFPLTQTVDNTFYLKHTWEGDPSSYGNIFLECKNDPDMKDFNTIIYGHHMRDGSMFAPLRNYAEQDFFEEHPYVYIVNDEGIFRYEVFSSYFAKVESKTYGLSFNQEQTRVDFLQMALDESEIDTGITPNTTDRILTLSTCTGWGYEFRRVVHARLEMIEVYDR